jgi:hypothetical protein
MTMYVFRTFKKVPFSLYQQNYLFDHSCILHFDVFQAMKDFIARQPMGRVGTAQEVADLCVYLASDEVSAPLDIVILTFWPTVLISNIKHDYLAVELHDRTSPHHRRRLG